MQYLDDLAAFAMVVRHRGFSAAARATNTSKSALSKRVSRLEDRLQVRLIERSARGFRVTAIGVEIFTHADNILTSAEGAEAAASLLTSAPRGTLRIACPPGLLHTALAEILSQFALRYPDIRVGVTVSNRRVDLVEEPFDLAIRAREKLDTDATLIIRKLGISRRILVASPAYLARRRLIEEPAALHGEQLLTLADDAGPAEWTLLGRHGEESAVSFLPRLAASDFFLLHHAALAGVGIALLTEAVSQASLRSGALVQVLPDWYSSETIVHLVFTSKRGLLPATRVLIDYLAEELPARLRAEQAERSGLGSPD